jgi:hypothetical protein
MACVCVPENKGQINTRCDHPGFKEHPKRSSNMKPGSQPPAFSPCPPCPPWLKTNAVPSTLAFPVTRIVAASAPVIPCLNFRNFPPNRPILHLPTPVLRVLRGSKDNSSTSTIPVLPLPCIDVASVAVHLLACPKTKTLRPFARSERQEIAPLLPSR